MTSSTASALTTSSSPSSPTRKRRLRALPPPKPAIRLSLTWLAALAGAVLLLSAVYRVDRYLATSPAFHLADLKIEGNRYATRDRIAQVFDQDKGQSVYLVSLQARRAQLERIDWIRDALVSRLWPNRIVVRVTERKPVAFVTLPELALVDASGVILAQPEAGQFALPVLRGLARSQPLLLRRERVQLMLDLMKQVGQAATRISEIDAAEPRDLQVTLASGARAYRLHLGNRNYASRMHSFFNHFEEVNKRFPNYTVFDMRLDGQMVAMEAR